ncbi:hypothetical protein C2S51_005488 [Perilla frutescens var. frutescens]|nr:hypothetical protein C2S51_005488 [Perilla frutescens var. frutescens]
MTDVSAKRKRGRPRKDSNLCREGGSSLENATSFMKSSTSVQVPHDEGKKCEEDWEVGSMVYGVVEGSFDAGYLISVRIGNNLAPFRGVVFQPRKVVAVTAANDVAPQAKMYERREIQVPVVYDNNNNNSNLSQGAAGAAPNYSVGNLRMVEEDEVMQAFEVSKKSLLGSNGKECSIPPSSPPNLYYNENLFTDQSQAKTTPNLKLDLAFTTTTTTTTTTTGSGGSHKENIGYHQALVAGNPLLLPPDLMGDFIMDKPKTPPPSNCNANNNNNMEVQSRFGGDDAITNAHLELATPHRIADMDFLLTNANQ